MDALLDPIPILGVALALASVLLLAGDPIDGAPSYALEGDEVMDAILGRTTKPVKSSPVLFYAVATAVVAVFFRVGGLPLLGGVPRPAPPPSACLMSGAGGLQPLDNTDSLENCGVRLEAVYLQEGEPVSGAYNGLRLFVDDQGIDTAQPHGPRERLIAPWLRVQIDNELHRLMRARDGGRMQISVVREP
jgi:hypothetical protein